MSINIDSHRLTLKRLIHRVKMIKSAAFIKITLTQHDVDPQALIDQETQRKVKQLTESLDQIWQAKRAFTTQEGFYYIKQAGWKLIAEAQSEEEQDSRCSSIISKIASVQSTKNPISRIQSIDPLSYLGTRRLSIDNNLDQKNRGQPTIDGKKLPRMDTYYTLKSDYSRAMKLKKRQIILRKIENIQLCLEYLDAQTKKQLNMLYSYFHSL